MEGRAARQHTAVATLARESSRDSENLLAILRDASSSTIGDARDRTGLGRNVFDAALRELVGAGLVHRIQQGQRTLLVPHRSGIEECLDQVKALWDPRVRRLHDFLATHELCPRNEVMDRAIRVWRWGKEITRWRLQILEKAELVQAILDPGDHRRILYRCQPAHPSARAVLDGIGDTA